MKNGFTLIELLAVIVILAIISLIVVPFVINIIEDTKINAVKRSSELYIDAIDLTLTKLEFDNELLDNCSIEKDKIICGEKEYLIEVDGAYPTFLEIDIDEDKKVETVFKYDGYCVMKKNNDISYKKIVDRVKNENTEVRINDCSLNPHTNENCFNFDLKTGTITGYYSYENNDNKNLSCPKNVIIPKNINGVEVKIIGIESFISKGLTSVEIPSTVTEIKRHAFYNNKLTELTIPEGVTTIEGNSFYGNQISKLTLPTSLKSLYPSAFAKNQLPEENAYFYTRKSDGSIDYSELNGYGGTLKNLVLPEEKNGVKLKTIGVESFVGLGLTSVEIPSTVTEIKRHAFYNNKLKELIIPNSVTSIAGNAFSSNPLERVTINNKKINVSIDSTTFGTFDINKILWIEK